MTKRRAQGTLKVYTTDGEQFGTRNEIESMFAVESETSASTLFVIDKGELAIVQNKTAARLTDDLCWELRDILNEYMADGEFLVGR